MLINFPVAHILSCIITFIVLMNKVRGYLKIPSNFSQNVTEPSKEISDPVGDLCQCFTKLTGPCAYTLHSNSIPPTDGTNGLL